MPSMKKEKRGRCKFFQSLASVFRSKKSKQFKDAPVEEPEFPELNSPETEKFQAGANSQQTRFNETAQLKDSSLDSSAHNTQPGLKKQLPRTPATVSQVNVTDLDKVQREIGIVNNDFAKDRMKIRPTKRIPAKYNEKMGQMNDNPLGRLSEESVTVHAEHRGISDGNSPVDRPKDNGASTPDSDARTTDSNEAELSSNSDSNERSVKVALIPKKQNLEKPKSEDVKRASSRKKPAVAKPEGKGRPGEGESRSPHSPQMSPKTGDSLKVLKSNDFETNSLPNPANMGFTSGEQTSTNRSKKLPRTHLTDLDNVTDSSLPAAVNPTSKSAPVEREKSFKETKTETSLRESVRKGSKTTKTGSFRKEAPDVNKDGPNVVDKPSSLRQEDTRSKADHQANSAKDGKAVNSSMPGKKEANADGKDGEAFTSNAAEKGIDVVQVDLLSVTEKFTQGSQPANRLSKRLSSSFRNQANDAAAAAASNEHELSASKNKKEVKTSMSLEGTDRSRSPEAQSSLPAVKKSGKNAEFNEAYDKIKGNKTEKSLATNEDLENNNSKSAKNIKTSLAVMPSDASSEKSTESQQQAIVECGSIKSRDRSVGVGARPVSTNLDPSSCGDKSLVTKNPQEASKSGAEAKGGDGGTGSATTSRNELRPSKTEDRKSGEFSAAFDKIKKKTITESAVEANSGSCELPNLTANERSISPESANKEQMVDGSLKPAKVVPVSQKPTRSKSSAKELERSQKEKDEEIMKAKTGANLSSSVKKLPRIDVSDSNGDVKTSSVKTEGEKESDNAPSSGSKAKSPPPPVSKRPVKVQPKQPENAKETEVAWVGMARRMSKDFTDKMHQKTDEKTEDRKSESEVAADENFQRGGARASVKEMVKKLQKQNQAS